jgi:glutamyl-tRNA reductase
LTQKFLHGTLASLNQSEEAERQQLLAWLPRIFPKGSDRR